MKDIFFSNCYIEAKKAEKRALKAGKSNIKILKLPRYMNGGHFFPHYAWIDTDTNTFYDFVKLNNNKNEIFFKGYIKSHTDYAWTKWVRRMRTQLLDNFNKAVGMDIGEEWHKCPLDTNIELDKCITGVIQISVKSKNGIIFKMLPIKKAGMKYIDSNKNIVTLEKLDTDSKITGWKYFNDFVPTERYSG